VTSAVLKHLRLRKRAIESNLGRGNALTPESAEQTLASTARSVGEISGIDYVLDLYTGDEPESEMERRVI
jgi:hypothetical protein